MHGITQPGLSAVALDHPAELRARSGHQSQQGRVFRHRVRPEEFKRRRHLGSDQDRDTERGAHTGLQGALVAGKVRAGREVIQPDGFARLPDLARQSHALLEDALRRIGPQRGKVQAGIAVPDIRRPHAACGALPADDVGVRRWPAGELGDVFERIGQDFPGRTGLVGHDGDLGKEFELALVGVELAQSLLGDLLGLVADPLFALYPTAQKLVLVRQCLDQLLRIRSAPMVLCHFRPMPP